MTKRTRVALVFGGRSTEHAISCVTAGSVLEAIDRDKYDVVPIGIAADGRWVLEADDPGRYVLGGARRLPSVDGSRSPVALGAEGFDVVFPLLHGPWGEDGTIQGLLEMTDTRYVGSGVLASAVCMDKAFMKIVLADAGLPVMPGGVVTAREWEADPSGVKARIGELGFPLFVKPARGGSSIGIAKAHDVTELADAIEGALAHDPKVLVEVSAEGAREVECGVLETLDGGVETTLPAEIRVSADHEFYDFEAKYDAEQHTDLDVPADLPDDVVAQIRDMSARAFLATGCEGLARVDFFHLSDGSLVINELNTMPGFTPLSMFPRMWAHSGLEYADLVDRLIQLALRRDTGLR
ncbi:MAG: D-alanine--D-alanine ligase [Nocardioidaceae bacterium]|nr:D-alanine--D-alanine ligase [Nocardioidaceae bacterium]MCL2613095.1 D-alanine--D-alanine ligase [Nocardioidaceae bacterium]